MAKSSPEVPGGVFISYRRSDSADAAKWLYGELVARFGDRRVFKDVDSIAPGDDFAEVITSAVGSCGVLLALIGPRWHEARLRERRDFVRLEIETAMAGNVRVIPVLVGGARLPRAEDLPAGMAGLVRRQAIELGSKHLSQLLLNLSEMLTPDQVAPGAPRVVRIEDCDNGSGATIATVACSHAGILASGSNAGVTVTALLGQRPGKMADFGHAGQILSVALGRDGWWLASGNKDGQVRRWNLHSMEELPVLTVDDAVFSVAFSPDGELLAASGRETVVLLDAQTGRLRRTLAGGQNGRVWAMAFSPDGRLLATGHWEGQIRLWDLAAAAARRVQLRAPVMSQPARRLLGHGYLTGIAFSPDGRLMATAGGMDETVRLWNPATGTHLRTLHGHQLKATAVAFSPDGRLLATASPYAVVLWDPETGERLRSLDNGATGLAFSPVGWPAGGPTGWLLAAAGSRVRMWYLAPA